MKTKVFLLAILILAFLFRFWQIAVFPFGFTPDEASFGYDAYSIIHTAKDQWGHLLPLTLESFGDYKLPLYSYLTIPSIAAFGLNVFSVRLPNSIIGTLAVLATYLMVSEFVKYLASYQKDSRFSDKYSILSLISAFFMAVSPWNIMMSRGAFEANLTTFLMPFGVYLFLRGLKNKAYLIFSSFIFGLNLFSYHSARLVTPLIVLTLIVIFANELKAKDGILASFWAKKKPLFIFGLFLLLSFYSLLIGGARRAQDISIFSGVVKEASDNRFPYLYGGISQDVSRIFVNKFQVSTRKFFSNYSQYFSPNFLFLNGPAEGTYGMIPGRGVLYWFELINLLAFFYFLAKSGNKLNTFLLVWFLIAPIPASLTTGSGYAANRSEITLPALAIMSGIGFYEINKILKKYVSLKILTVAYVFVFAFSIVSFSIDYFFVSPFNNSKAMLWGNLDVANWLARNSGDYSNVVVSRNLSEPHIYIGFANKWDPADYQLNSKNWAEYKSHNFKFLDQLDGYTLGKYKFSSIDYKSQKILKDTLLVGRPDEFPSNMDFLIKFVAPNGETTVVIAESSKDVYAEKLY